MIMTFDDSKSGTTVDGNPVEIQFDMDPKRQYRLVAKGADLWFKVVAAGGAGAAVAGDGSHFLPAGQAVPVAAVGGKRTRISIIRDAAVNGTGCLSATPYTGAL